MSKRHTVLRCTRRRDDTFMVEYLKAPKVTGIATSLVDIPVGRSVAVLDGKVVMRGVE